MVVTGHCSGGSPQSPSAGLVTFRPGPGGPLTVPGTTAWVALTYRLDHLQYLKIHLTFPPMLYFFPSHSSPPLSAELAMSLVRNSFPWPQVTAERSPSSRPSSGHETKTYMIEDYFNLTVDDDPAPEHAQSLH